MWVSVLCNKIDKLTKTDRELVFNMLGALMIKGAGLVLSLFTMPAYIRFFNDDTTLGLWFTVLSVLSWMMYFDFGIGNGLRNCLSRSLAEGNYGDAHKYVSSAYLSIGVLCAAMILLFFPVSEKIPWNDVFNIKTSSVSREALHLTVCIVFVGIMLQLFFRLINSVLYAIQKSALNNLLGLIHSLVQVLALNLLPSFDNDRNLVVMAFINIVATILPLLAATVIVFSSKKYRDIAPTIGGFTWEHSKSVLALGGTFLLAQMLYMVIMNTNEYLIMRFADGQGVVDYQVYYRLFTLIGTLFALLMTPIWSAITKALAEKRQQWVQSLYRKAWVIAGICILGEFLLVPFAQIVVNIWLRDAAIPVQETYGVGFAIFASLMIINNVLSTFANGMGHLKTQVVCFAVGATIKIPLAWFFVGLFDSWIGVIWANTLALFIYCAVQVIIFRKNLLLQEVRT